MKIPTQTHSRVQDTKVGAWAYSLGEFRDLFLKLFPGLLPAESCLEQSKGPQNEHQTWHLECASQVNTHGPSLLIDHAALGQDPPILGEVRVLSLLAAPHQDGAGNGKESLAGFFPCLSCTSILSVPTLLYREHPLLFPSVHLRSPPPESNTGFCGSELSNICSPSPRINRESELILHKLTSAFTVRKTDEVSLFALIV